MTRYIKFFRTRREHDDAYKTESGEYTEPWSANVKRLSRTENYFVTYNKGVEASKTYLSFIFDGEEKAIDIDCLYAWTAECDDSWVTFSPSGSTSGESVLTITAEMNSGDTRNTKIILRDTKGDTTIIKVEQEAYKEHIEIPRYIYIDDFLNPEDIAEDAGYSSFEEYMDYYIDDPDNFGSNKYRFTGRSIEYDGTEYYLYKNVGDIGGWETVAYGLLPVDSSYQYLYSNSMESDYDNRLEPFDYILEEDNDLYIEKGDGHEYVVVKIDDPIDPHGGVIVPPQGLWVDDFPDGVEDGCSCGEFQTPYDPDFCDCFYGFEAFEDYVDDYLSRPTVYDNYWRYVEDFEFNGVEYFMYEMRTESQTSSPYFYGLLPKKYSIEQLQQMSMENDCMNRMQPFDYILSTDFEVAYEFPHEGPVGYSDNYVLVKVDP